MEIGRAPVGLPATPGDPEGRCECSGVICGRHCLLSAVQWDRRQGGTTPAACMGCRCCAADIGRVSAYNGQASAILPYWKHRTQLMALTLLLLQCVRYACWVYPYAWPPRPHRPHGPLAWRHPVGCDDHKKRQATRPAPESTATGGISHPSVSGTPGQHPHHYWQGGGGQHGSHSNTTG